METERKVESEQEHHLSWSAALRVAALELGYTFPSEVPRHLLGRLMERAECLSGGRCTTRIRILVTLPKGE